MNPGDYLSLLFRLPGALVALPLLGAAAALLVPRRACLAWAVLVSLAVLGLALPLWSGYGPGTSGVRFEVDLPWFELLNAQIRIHMGVDGISLLLVLLAALLAPVALLSAPGRIQERRREFAFWMLLAEAGTLGTLLSLDIVLFYLFWELTLIPLWFAIGIWGGPGRQRAAGRFLGFNLAGSLLMLAALLHVVLHSQQAGAGGELVAGSTQILELARRPPLPWTAQALCFLGFACAFALRIPLFPLHPWAPGAQAEAPGPGSIFLAGIAMKLGVYGFLRLCLPLFPAASRFFGPWIMGLALAGILYFGLLALAERDLKRLVAWAGLGQIGLAVVGLFALDPAALKGSIVQLMNHGLALAALFLAAGALQARFRTNSIEGIGGVARATPRLALALAAAALASIGLPGTGGFPAWLMVLQGAFKAGALPGAAAIAGLLLGAFGMLSMAGRALLRPSARTERPADIGWRETGLLAPLLALSIWIGLDPGAFTSRMERALDETLQRVARFEPPAPGLR